MESSNEGRLIVRKIHDSKIILAIKKNPVMVDTSEICYKIRESSIDDFW